MKYKMADLLSEAHEGNTEDCSRTPATLTANCLVSERNIVPALGHSADFFRPN
jgi:hypothetical protein